MPFEGEYATGESLLSLQQSEAFREFKGQVRSLFARGHQLRRQFSTCRAAVGLRGA